MGMHRTRSHLRIARRVSPEDNPTRVNESLQRSVQLYEELALEAQETGRYVAALRNYEKALQLSRRAFGADSEEVWCAHRNLAALYVTWKDASNGVPHYLAALDAAKRHADAQTPTSPRSHEPSVYQIALTDLAECYTSVGDAAVPKSMAQVEAYRESLRYLDEAAVMVPEAGSYGYVIAKAKVQEKLGRYAAAIDGYEYALHLVEKVKLELIVALPPRDLARAPPQHVAQCCERARKAQDAHALRVSACAIQRAFRRLAKRRRNYHLRPVVALLGRVGRGYLTRRDRDQLPARPAVRLFAVEPSLLVTAPHLPALYGTQAEPLRLPSAEVRLVPRRESRTMFWFKPPDVHAVEQPVLRQTIPPKEALVGRAAVPPALLPERVHLAGVCAPPMIAPRALPSDAVQQTDAPPALSAVAAPALCIPTDPQWRMLPPQGDFTVQCAMDAPRLHRMTARPIPPMLPPPPPTLKDAATQARVDPALQPRAAEVIAVRRAAPPPPPELRGHAGDVLIVPEMKPRLHRVRGAKLVMRADRHDRRGDGMDAAVQCGADAAVLSTSGGVVEGTASPRAALSARSRLEGSSQSMCIASRHASLQAITAAPLVHPRGDPQRVATTSGVATPPATPVVAASPGGQPRGRRMQSTIGVQTTPKRETKFAQTEGGAGDGPSGMDGGRVPSSPPRPPSPPPSATGVAASHEQRGRETRVTALAELAFAEQHARSALLHSCVNSWLEHAVAFCSAVRAASARAQNAAVLAVAEADARVGLYKEHAVGLQNTCTVATYTSGAAGAAGVAVKTSKSKEKRGGAGKQHATAGGTLRRKYHSMGLGAPPHHGKKRSMMSTACSWHELEDPLAFGAHGPLQQLIADELHARTALFDRESEVRRRVDMRRNLQQHKLMNAARAAAVHSAESLSLETSLSTFDSIDLIF